MEQPSTPHDGQNEHHGDDRSTEEIRRDIEWRRASIARTVDQAGQKLHQSVDWREQLREHPYGGLGLAAFAGFTLAAVVFRSPVSTAERLAWLLTDGTRPRSGLGRGVRRAVTGLATRSVIKALRRRLEHDGARPRHSFETTKERTG